MLSDRKAILCFNTPSSNPPVGGGVSGNWFERLRKYYTHFYEVAPCESFSRS
jgi:hypothetical protein